MLVFLIVIPISLISSPATAAMLTAERDHRRVEQIRDQRVHQHQPAHPLRLRGHVADLAGDGDAEREIQELAIVRACRCPETLSPLRLRQNSCA